MRLSYVRKLFLTKGCQLVKDLDVRLHQLIQFASNRFVQGIFSVGVAF